MTTRYCRFQHEGGAHHGRIEGEEVVVLSGAPWAGGADTGRRVALSAVQLLVPSEASKVVCIGQNYRKHAEEMGKPVPAEPLLFIKPSTALNAHRSPIQLPRVSEEVHYEAELGLVIGERLKNADEATAARAIWGLTCINDVTARDIQRREIQHTRAKSYDTFACAGPWSVTGLSPADLRIVCRVNGQVRQDSRTSDMVFSPARLVSFISHIMTLLPGDLVSTGTPSGVGRLVAGDVVEVELEGIGTLANPVEMGP
ncbi:2-keto-4-pentenoate hydratase/2-oxohepta-3-ene-1,7-dioic acid hydratase in catechol pathway [Archangium gephyra]|uniref:2-hydroxyhepta-2,4-diene-1,7-dioate isomerase n=1 Tax=Archangium gephyra TaxID=48 RepID=A0AAC8QH45_9BACT|nr:fumarylacetoacetate hydrolase family protein [Archangium gephyra]AKJ06965.1 2-hydroxyhepta-2,4-diene-1,7-dioate isomerase [Archangium gephyra]REG31747.1 2-keto-4-pentenoate hydratase/2-oxohepta-3-ene-1,7-dioic acid hydratase in catechol pathway [Archangium gephyra]